MQLAVLTCTYVTYAGSLKNWDWRRCSGRCGMAAISCLRQVLSRIARPG